MEPYETILQIVYDEFTKASVELKIMQGSDAEQVVFRITERIREAEKAALMGKHGK